MKWMLWLDDQADDPDTPARHPLPGYTRALSSAEAEQLVLEKGMPSKMNIDHDLGGNDSAMVFLNWLARKAHPEGPVPTVLVHSANPCGLQSIISFVDSWRRSLVK